MDFYLEVDTCAPLEEGISAGAIYYSLCGRNYPRRCLLPLATEWCRAGLTLLSAALITDGRWEECHLPTEKQRFYWLYLLIARRGVKFILQGILAMFLTKPDKEYYYFYKTCPKERGKALLYRNDFEANTYYYWKVIILVHWPEAKPCLILPVLKFWVLERGLTERGYTSIVTTMIFPV